MNLHVRLQRDRLDKPFRADRTLVWPFAGVRHHVMLERFVFAKGSIAEFARVRFDAAVHDADVAREVACVVEDMGIDRIFKLNYYMVHLDFKRTDACKHHNTLVARP